MQNDENDPALDEDELGFCSFKRTPKDPKGSARQKFNRRKLWLASSLENLELAIDDVLSQPGKIYKRDELERLKKGITDFFEQTGLPRMDEQFRFTNEQIDLLDLTMSAYCAANSAASSS
jgi:hypothetical protein